MKKLLAYFLLVLCCSHLFGQPSSKEELQRKSQELKNELQAIKQDLEETRGQKKATYGSWIQIRNKIDTREKLIGNIKDQVYYIEKDISRTYREIDTMKKEMDTLRAQYAKSVIYAYKNKSNYDFLNFIFSAGNFNDAIKRLQYLKTYRQYREQQAGEIKKTKQLLENKIASLTGKRVEKSTALTEQSKQMSELEKEKQEKDKVLADLNAREGELAKTMKNREAQRNQIDRKIKQVIADEIAAARKEEERKAKLRKAEEDRKAVEKRKADLAAAAERKAALEKENRDKAAANTNTSKPPVEKSTEKPDSKPVVTTPTATVDVEKPKPTRTISPLEQTPESLVVSEDFVKSKRLMPWPVDQGYITLHFGTNSIPAKPRPINLQSNGVTFKTQIGSAVKSIFDGEVSSVFEVMDKTVVMVRHGKYFSVYSNLSSASVSKGAKISRGQTVGKAGENDEGEGEAELDIVTDKGVNLDPEQWIRRR